MGTRMEHQRARSTQGNWLAWIVDFWRGDCAVLCLCFASATVEGVQRQQTYSYTKRKNERQERKQLK